jgi:CRISPR-associated protein Csd1
VILQALCALADREGLVADPDFEYKPVAWIVRVRQDGKLLAIESTHQELTIAGRRKAKPQPRSFLVPRRVTGKSGTKAPADFFVDNAKYVFGHATSDKSFSETEGAEKSGWFRTKVIECANTTRDGGAIAVATLLTDVNDGTQNIDLPQTLRSNDLFAFALGTDLELVHLRPAIRDHWRLLRLPAPQEGASESRCLVTGAAIHEAGLFPPIKGVPGGTSSGVGLVSFNHRAFESHGWNGTENAPVSRAAAEKVATALARLLSRSYPNPRHPEEHLKSRRVDLNDSTVVLFWTSSESGEQFANVFDQLVRARAEDADQVGELYRSVWRGRQPHLAEPSAFYSLILSGAQGRAVIRDWIESSVSDTAAALARHFSDLDIVRNARSNDKESPSVPLRHLLEALAPLGKGDAIPSALSASLIRCALTGTPYPFGLLQNALLRARAEAGRRARNAKDAYVQAARKDARAALIKAVLIRTCNVEVSRAMDPKNVNPGYLLGRLMAVIERMQQAALGNQINATVVDRYFGGASATPSVVFPRLLKNLRNHARKAKDESQTAGTAFWLEGEVDGIVKNLRGFPSHLDLQQQGLFVIGYHHERHWLWLPRAEREAFAGSASQS